MKKVIVIFLFISCYLFSFSQPAVVGRASDAVVASDGGIFARNTLRPPVYSDTSTANSSLYLLDSCGKLIFTYDFNSYWLRACNPKRWIKILKTGDVASALANNGLSKNGDTVQFGQTISAVGNPAALNSSREIPLNGFNTVFSGTGSVGIGTTTPGSTVKLQVLASGTNTGVSSSTGTGLAVSGFSSVNAILGQSSGTGIGVSGSASGGIGVQGSGGISGIGGRFTTIAQGGVSDEVALQLEKLPTGTGSANGIGFTVMFKNPYINQATASESGKIKNYFTDANSASASSAFEFHLVNNAVSAMKMLISPNGQLTLGGYPALTQQTDTTNIKPLGYNTTTGVVQPMDSWVGGGGSDSIFGKSYYAAQNGLSTGDGATIATAVNMDRLVVLSADFIGGERIFFKANDTLRGSLTIKPNTIVTRYDTGRAPIIAGTIRSTTLTWTQDGVVWKAPYPTRVGRVLRNGIPERTAQSSFYTVTSRPASNQITASGATGLGSWVPDAEMITKEYNFRWRWHDISAYNTGTGNFTLDNDDGIVANYQFRLFNHNQLIAADGDWAWVNDSIYYRSPGNVNPNTLNVELSVYETGLTFENLGSNYNVSNVDFYAQSLYGIRTNSVNNIAIDNCGFYKQFETGIFIDDSCINLKVIKCTIDSVGDNGIMAAQYGKDFTFDKLNISHIGTQVDPPFARQNNVPFENGINGMGMMLYPSTSNVTISNCSIDSTAYNGINPQCRYSIISNNEISHFGIRQNDGGGIHMGADSLFYFSVYGWREAIGNVVNNNIVHHGVGFNEGGPFEQAFAVGIYSDNGSNYNKIEGNVCYDNNFAGINCGFGNHDNEIIGNVCWANSSSQIAIYNNTGLGHPATSGMKVRNNILASNSESSFMFKLVDLDAGGTWTPFSNGGYCLDNPMVTPINNFIVLGESSSFTLPNARVRYGVNFGQEDDYKPAALSDSAFRILIPLDVNRSPKSRWSIMPENYRAPLNRYYNVLMPPGTANVYVTATNDLTINHNGGATSFSFKKDGIEEVLGGIANASNEMVNGSANHWFVLRTNRGGQIYSADSGITNTLRLNTNNSLKFGGYGSGANTGTTAFNLAVNSAGDLIETPANVILGTGILGHVAFFSAANSISYSNAFFWDNNSGRLGLNTTTPTRRISINEVTGAPLMSFNRNGSESFFFGASDGVDQIINGTVAGDGVIRANGSNGVLISAGGGNVAQVNVQTTGVAVLGTTTNNAAAAGFVGEEISSTVSTYTNYTTTATYQNITSITLTAGDWDLSAFFTYSSNSATITAAANAIFVISTTTASAAGATEGQNISYVPQAALLGTSLFSDAITPYRVSLSGTTTYYLNSQATFTLGNPQYTGSIRARRCR